MIVTRITEPIGNSKCDMFDLLLDLAGLYRWTSLRFASDLHEHPSCSSPENGGPSQSYKSEGRASGALVTFRHLSLEVCKTERVRNAQCCNVLQMHQSMRNRHDTCYLYVHRN